MTPPYETHQQTLVYRAAEGNRYAQNEKHNFDSFALRQNRHVYLERNPLRGQSMMRISAANESERISMWFPCEAAYGRSENYETESCADG